MKWSLKCKKQDPTLVRLAEFINKANSNDLVSPGTSIYSITTLPYYSDFKLYTFRDLSFTPYLEMRLLDNGTHTLMLDGTQNPFLVANTISPLVLTSRNVYQYAMLVLGNTKKNDSSYRLINSIDEVNFSAEPTKEQYQLLESSIKAARIKKDKEFFLIRTTMFFDDSVIDASINITFDGRVDIIKEKKLLGNMPIRELILE